MPHFVSSGNDYKILNVDLTDAYQNISIPRSFNSFVMQTRNGSTIKIRRSSSDTTNEFTLKDGQPYAIDGSMGVKVGETQVVCQAKVDGVGGTDVLEILYWFI